MQKFENTKITVFLKFQNSITCYTNMIWKPGSDTNWRKIWFCIPYKTHSGNDIHGSISFMIDNMHYVILRIWEQDSVPWCGEIQNKRLDVLGNTFNLHSNSTLRPRSVVSQSVSKRELSSGFTRTYTPLHNNDSLKINLCMFLSL